ncbi:BTAD domain-containing putative transcriptional regulator [Nonomuraea sp. NPDC051941]|uniref:BTAD domain-containing putative transcriptional regulator n=1 Tax=Nonomuraea sp. NPDC051941 TaxID=3364373 RepID=UPI0037C5DE8F
MLTFTALGPFQAWADGAPLDLGGQRQRAVLARLLVAGGRAVPVNTLIDELWPGAPPAQALSTIQGYVSRLRRALEPDRAPREEARVLVSAPPGYALRAATEQVDAWRFEALVKSEGDPGRVWAAMDTALELWRGPALAEFGELSWAATEAGRLEELRLIAVERRAGAGLALGRATSLVADLEAHASAYPLREEAWRLLATGLYGLGRQGDALAALRRARSVWRDELGLDLSAGLQRLEADMLAQRLESPAPEEQVPVEAPAAVSDIAPLRVVVADDQALVRAGVRAMLDAEPGVTMVGEATNGEEAIALVAETGPDVVLLDIQMPHLDGLAAARRILSENRPPKVIMMTTFGSDENLYAALRAGVSGFILKTSAPEQFLAAIRAASAGDALIDPTITTRLIAGFAGRVDPASPPALAGLADSQLDVLKLVARGLTNRQIGQTLSLSEEEVAIMVKSLLEHLGLFDRAQLVMAAYESGFVTPGEKTSFSSL